MTQAAKKQPSAGRSQPRPPERRALPGGRFVSAGSTRTGSDGTADIRVAPASTTVYRITPRAYRGLQKQATVRVRQRLRQTAFSPTQVSR